MNKRIPELDALRGIAAIAVVIFHVFLYKPGYDWVRFGVTGVDLFFMISGFVIFMSISHVANAREFIINRFARLFPVYWTCVTITFVLFLIQYLKVFHYPFSFSLFGVYATNLTMLQNYFGIKDMDGSYWTLLVELQFYTLIVILYQLKLLKQIEKIGLIFLVGILIYSTVFTHSSALDKNVAIYAPIINHFSLFFAGIIFYKLYFKLINVYKAFAIILSCFLLQTLIFDHAGKAFNFLTRADYVSTLTVYFIFFMLLAYKKIIFITRKYILFLGKISYPLYVIHQFVSVYFLMPFFVNKLKLPIWMAGSITIIFVIVLAALITNYIEIPMRVKLKKRFTKVRKQDFVAVGT
jgi:peptidoglycan/LPS O-acetylase OafA/YrhL